MKNISFPHFYPAAAGSGGDATIGCKKLIQIPRQSAHGDYSRPSNLADSATTMT